MPNLPLMPLIGGAFAALCLVALPLWIMGIPGDPGDPDNPSPYVRGWTMGLNVLWVYPLVWALNFLPYFALRGLVSSEVAERWQTISQSVGALALFAAVVRMAWAIRILSKN